MILTNILAYGPTASTKDVSQCRVVHIPISVVLHHLHLVPSLPVKTPTPHVHDSSAAPLNGIAKMLIYNS